MEKNHISTYKKKLNNSSEGFIWAVCVLSFILAITFFCFGFGRLIISAQIDKLIKSYVSATTDNQEEPLLISGKLDGQIGSGIFSEEAKNWNFVIYALEEYVTKCYSDGDCSEYWERNCTIFPETITLNITEIKLFHVKYIAFDNILGKTNIFRPRSSGLESRLIGYSKGNIITILGKYTHQGTVKVERIFGGVPNDYLDFMIHESLINLIIGGLCVLVFAISILIIIIRSKSKNDNPKFDRDEIKVRNWTR